MLTCSIERVRNNLVLRVRDGQVEELLVSGRDGRYSFASPSAGLASSSAWDHEFVASSLDRCLDPLTAHLLSHTLSEAYTDAYGDFEEGRTNGLLRRYAPDLSAYRC